MKRVLLIILLHLSLFFIIFAYHTQAEELEEEWSIERFENLIFARVYGEVIHGDSLNFFIRASDNCEKVWHNFTFYTYEQPGDIKQLLHKHIPIKINNEEVTAYVDHIMPFLQGYRVLFSLGSFPIKEYIYKLNNFYIEEKKFEIKIIDGLDFKTSKYFDISINSWKLDKLVPSVLEAHRKCKEISNLNS
ncbi:hypothetical protein [Candidatus Pelagibacter communis]|uniref:hypothetical protein n=1 Tax=Pelagibacter ubique TaxID=198252 RepID=UPI00094CA31F|nr:hypothetical protein [Candidatus Pelagibacter ubique]